MTTPPAPKLEPMTPEQVIQMAKEAGFDARRGEVLVEGLDITRTLERFASIVRAAAPKLEPMTDEQIEPMFRHRHAVPTVGEKDAWYWYAWGVSDGEAHHGISAKGAAE